MSTVEKIKEAIAALPKPDYILLRKWFIENDWEKWDRQIEADAKSGKLNFLVKEAFDEKTLATLSLNFAYFKNNRKIETSRSPHFCMELDLWKSNFHRK